jgi:hypothetical protein
LLLAVLAHALAAMRDEVLEQLEAKIAALSDELGQVRADLTIARAFNNNKTDADVIDLPTLPLRRRAG